MPTLAEQQLAAWVSLAEDWPVSFDAGHNQQDRSYRCGDCGKGIALALDEQRHRYLYTETQWMALVVLHLRNHHADLDPDLH